ncbi:MAG: Ig-like domain-containing protein [Ruminococcus sp.]|nr:Ig-like domain-containing protein [Ruminococcus sp.]
MKALKKTLSLVLAVCILASMACVAAVSASANAGDILHRYNVKDIVNKDPDNQINTKTYMFYMPDSWRNTFNDTYVEEEGLASCSAGIYWWGGSYNAKDYQGELTNDWPGFAVTETLPEDKNIFVAQVPEDVPQIIWNNLVDGGPDSEKDLYPDRYVAAIQTSDIPCEFYDADEDDYGFYPNGVENFDGMIFVCNPQATEVNEYSGKATYKGVWLYYYGNGEYGKYATREEAEANNGVCKDGVFPEYGFRLDVDSVSIKVGESTKITPNDKDAVATVEDATIASITTNPDTGAVTVKGLKAGKTNVIFTLTKNGESESITCPVTVTKPVTTISISAKAKSIYIKKTTKVTASVKNGVGTTTFTSSNKKVATVDSKGNVKGIKKGTVTITAKNNGKTASVKITVNNPKLNKTKATLKVKKTLKLKVTGGTGKVKYSSSKKKVATVNGSGKVTAKKKGKANIKVKVSGVTLTCKITVKK